MDTGRGKNWWLPLRGQYCSISRLLRVPSQYGAEKGSGLMSPRRTSSVSFNSVISTSRIGGEDQRDAGPPVAAIRNPADAGNEGGFGIADLPSPALSHQLPYRLDQIGAASGKPRLSGRDLSAAGVERQFAVMAHVRGVDESRPLAPAAESQHLPKRSEE